MQWETEMLQPLPGTTKGPRKPTPREVELEAEGFMALYAQVGAP